MACLALARASPGPVRSHLTGLSGAAACAGCHPTQTRAWEASHHAKAMAVADAALPGAAYAIGVYPLRQPLVALPDGRIQVLGLAWDARPPAAGGQRWFEPDPAQPAWDSRDATWNFMCAPCHVTALERGYDVATDSYRTTWSDLAVACAACHAPGSDLADGGSWRRAPEADTASRSAPRSSRREIESCARCHARGTLITETSDGASALFDVLRPVLLDEGLYFADGQIQGEVFEYGSFLQSRMAEAGVTCSDCHEPHSLALRAEGNALCARCHRPETFDTPRHHRHAAGTPAARCVSCHMPTRTYMAIDERRDHAIRVPRPDADVGSPDACTNCHTDRSPGWAADAIARWHGPPRGQHYGPVIAAARAGRPAARGALAELALDRARPAIVRGTALSLFSRFTSAWTPAMAAALQAAVRDPDPLVRLGALDALGALSPADRRVAAPLLRDPARGVRVEAASLLMAARSLLEPGDRAALDASAGEYRDAQMAIAERPESHVNLGNLYADAGSAARAEEAFRTALRLDPAFAPASLNLADLYRATGRDEEGEGLIRRVLEGDPDNAAARYALGLRLVRAGRVERALPELARAVARAPEEPRYALASALARASAGDASGARAALEAAIARHPADRDLLVGLLEAARVAGDDATVARCVEDLRRIFPEDPYARSSGRAPR